MAMSYCLTVSDFEEAADRLLARQTDDDAFEPVGADYFGGFEDGIFGLIEEITRGGDR